MTLSTPPIPTSKPRVALFDLDHTLLPLDSDHAWGEFTIALGWTDATAFKQRNDHFYAQYQTGTLNVHDYVRFATDAVRQQGPERAQAAHAAFMREVIEPAIRPQAKALLRQHQEAGDAVVIVTATNEFVTRPIARALGVDELIAVALERTPGPDRQGWITGGILGVPSFRDGKVTRVAAWLAERGWTWDSVHTTFYSDSMNDLPLLERVNHPVATNPDDRLRALAEARGWPVLDLF